MGSMSMLLITSLNPKQLNAAAASTMGDLDNLPPLPSKAEATLSDAMEDIRVRAETMSSLLRDIIDRPPRHWGINE
jgi:hypothetical protein